MRRSALLALAALLAAGFPRAAAAIAPIELIRPAPGEVLVAGGRAELEWRPSDEAALGPDFVEWEVFLSLDGGRTYPLRISPHLDRRVTRFGWQVPWALSGDVRFLVRYGNEQNEVGFELAPRWAIAAGAEPPLPRAGLPSLPALGAGESARPGDAGVVGWVEGSRAGQDLRQVFGRGFEVQPRGPRLSAGIDDPLAVEGRPAPRLQGPADHAGANPSAPPLRPVRLAPPPAAGSLPIPILLQTKRRNE